MLSVPAGTVPTARLGVGPAPSVTLPASYPVPNHASPAASTIGPSRDRWPVPAPLDPTHARQDLEEQPVHPTPARPATPAPATTIAPATEPRPPAGDAPSARSTGSDHAEDRYARPRGGPVVVAVAVAAFMALAYVAGAALVGTSLADLGDVAAAALDGWWATVLNPWYWGFLAVLVLFELAFPARRELRSWSVGLAEDLVWFVMSTVLGVTLVAGFLAVLESVYSNVLGGPSLDLQDELGTWGLPLVALVVTDLMAWLSHYLHHKVPVLWSFHAVHHSQEEMNVLSDSRQHVVETMLTATLVFLPARFLGLDVPAASALAFLSIYVGAFIHANIRTNLGPARYLVISPQAHRVHHSAAAEHIDTNFGVILACWDYLFGTRYHDDDAYPTTGIHDRSFPLERRAHPLSLFGTWVRQNVYPFEVLLSGGSRAQAAVPVESTGEHEAVGVPAGTSSATASMPPGGRPF